ncbi:hemerythrin domain-containing protein [Sphingomonas gilva]|uniref:Hemerythrin domain-containing protein n=1 Tax=Sphingomonas gilva TaxID=2305907 RepID=A0A396RL07_9SPHN|nr:hemerythrin domain-containing protein [Sphingomonas gilva]RHW16789.1 hemerythrin domain-containing protein [Sphingomonas gilva]
MADARIFEDLKADHDRHRKLLAELAGTSEGSPNRRRLFEAFRVEVTAHAAAEEMSLYATMLAKPDLRDDAQHSVSEHKEIEDFLGELYEMDMASSAWTEKFAAMRHRYEHHIDEEEEEMFPAAAEGLDEAEVKRLAAVFEARKPQEKQRAREEPPEGEKRE